MNTKLSQMLFKTAADLNPNIINESVLDPIQTTRCPDIFNSDDIMKENVKNQILDIFNTWAKDRYPVITLRGLRLIGSSSGFQYRDDSDIDVEADIEYDDNEKRLVKLLPNGNNLIGTSHPINFYLVNLKTSTYPDDKFAENIYDILNEKWIKKSDKTDLKVPFTYVEELSRFFSDSFDLSLSQFNRIKLDYQRLSDLNPEKHEISEQEIAKAFSDLSYDLKATTDRLKLGRSVLKGFQDSAFHGNNIFKISVQYMTDDPRFSVNNLIYKNLERLGYHDRINESISEANELSKKIDAKLK